MAVIPMEIDDQAMNQIKATFLQSAQEAFKAVSKRQTFGRYMRISKRLQSTQMWLKIRLKRSLSMQD